MSLDTAQKEELDKRNKEAEEAVGALPEFPQRDLTDEECGKLADFILAFAQSMTGTTLFPYELEFGWRICYSLLVEDAEEITALFSRQSGKTETCAVVVCGLCAILPLIGALLKHDSRIGKFSEGLRCGIYAPNYMQAGIMWNRMRKRMYSPQAAEALLDPDINIDLIDQKQNLVLPNGSFVDCGTASPQSTIEGATYHLVLLEECQDIDVNQIRQSIHPMLAATAGTIVKIGTCSPEKSDFFEACRRNRRNDVAAGLLRRRERCHFEFDYTVAQRYNPRYRKYVAKEIERLGYESDDFRMKYRLHWILERGMFVNEDLFMECGISAANDILVYERAVGKKKVRLEFKRPQNVVTYDVDTPNQMAAIDIGRAFSTVVTIGKVFWEGGVAFGKETRYPIHVYNWLELYGDDHEAQQPQIEAFLKNYRLSSVIIDATGKGDPVYSRLSAVLDQYDITTVPFIFNAASKDVGYKTLLQELTAKRLTFPSGAKASRTQKWQRFHSQMTDLEKSWRGGTMVVQKPDQEAARDDYPDSLMMLNWLVNIKGSMQVETGVNPLVGRSARWHSADMVKQAGAWYRSVSEPRARVRESKWD